MSIIYEALKKAEGEQILPKEIKIRSKKRFPTGLLVIIALAAASFVFFSRYYSGLRQETSLPQENLSFQPVESKEEIPSSLPAGSQNLPQKKYQLSGIIFDQESPCAIIDGQVLKESDQIDNYLVEDISQDKVELADINGNNRLVLSLDSF